MPHLWGKLRDRKMLQWLGAYLAAAWLLLQVVQYLTDTFGWGSRVQQFATLLLGVGFLAALVIAWFHGEKGQQRVSAIEGLLLIGVLGVAGSAVAWLNSRTRAAADPAERVMVNVELNSVAVLPFVDLSPTGDRTYFTDGIAEDILNALAQVPGLRVSSRSSSFQFKGVDNDVREVARKLGVAHILEGSVQRVGGRVRITAKLVKGSDGYHVWSKRFDRELSDIFALQDEIARNIADTLQLQLGSGPTLVSVSTGSPEAYDLYLRGRHLWLQGGDSAAEKSLAYFQKAIELDPNYALAYAGMADSYNHLYDAKRAKAAATKALALDSGLAEARVAMAYVLGYFELKWAEADRVLQQALAINPNDVLARQRRAYILTMQRRFPESTAEMEIARRLDPLSPVVAYNYSVIYADARRYDQAIRQLRSVLELYPQEYALRSQLGWLFMEQGDTAAAVREFEVADDTFYMMLARRDLDGVARMLKHPRFDQNRHTYLAWLELARDNVDQAMKELMRAADAREMDLLFLLNARHFDSHRADPRFRAVLKKLNLNY